jgi:hypothetical protein
MGSAVNGVKRFVLWDYPRAGWQYDVMVALILAFIFITPRDWFRDQPRADNVLMLPSDRGNTVFWMDAQQLASVPESTRAAKASSLIQARTGKKYHVVRLEPLVDSEQEIKGFMAFTTP